MIGDLHLGCIHFMNVSQKFQLLPAPGYDLKSYHDQFHFKAKI